MRLIYGSLIAGVICLGFTVGCDKGQPPEGVQKNIQKGQAVGETQQHINKPGYTTKQDAGQPGAAKEKNKE